MIRQNAAIPYYDVDPRATNLSMLELVYNSALKDLYENATDYITKIVDPALHMEIIVKKGVSYILENDYFYEENFGKLTKDEVQKLKLLLVFEGLDRAVDVPTLKQFAHKSGIDKNLLKQYLNRQKIYLESVIRELG